MYLMCLLIGHCRDVCLLVGHCRYFKWITEQNIIPILFGRRLPFTVFFSILSKDVGFNLFSIYFGRFLHV